MLHLVLPLRGHDLSIHAGDVDASKVAGLQVRLHNVARNGSARSGRAVVGALGSREAALGPPQGPLGGGVQKRVLLHNQKVGLHDQHMPACIVEKCMQSKARQVRLRRQREAHM